MRPLVLLVTLDEQLSPGSALSLYKQQTVVCCNNGVLDIDIDIDRQCSDFTAQQRRQLDPLSLVIVIADSSPVLCVVIECVVERFKS